MKIHDLLTENKQIDEAPLGLMQRAGLGIKSAFGNAKAAGQLDTGKDANSLHSEYMNFIGKTGDEPTPDNLIAFLKGKGYPTAKASQILGMPADATPNPSADAAAQTRKDKQAVAAKSAQDQMAANTAAPKPAPQTPADIRAAKQAKAGQVARDQLAASPELPRREKPAAPAANAAPTAKTAPKGEPDAMGRIEPTLDMPPEEQPKAGYNNQLAGGKQTISTGSKFDPATMQNTPGEPVGPGVQGGVPKAAPGIKKSEPKPAVWKNARNPGAPAATSPQAAAAIAPEAPPAAEPAPADVASPAPSPSARPQGGGRVKGQLSQSPAAQAKRAKRASSGTTSRLQTGESIEFDGLIISEALSDKQIDAALLAAAQEKARGGSTKAAPAAQAATAAAPAAQAGSSSDDSGMAGSMSNVAKHLLTPKKWQPKASAGGMGSDSEDVLDGIDTRLLKQALMLVLKGEALDDKSSAEVKKLYDKL